MNQDYTPGEGCQCSAYNESECGCDVDWTPKEVYELKATIVDMEIRHSATMLHTQSIVSEANELREECMEQARLLGMGAEREAKLMAERDLWRDEAERWREQAGENFQVTAWKQLIAEHRNKMRDYENER
jgi:hypothetical protein